MKHKPSGIILAGGRGRRMGTDKKNLRYGNKTFLEHAAELLRPHCDDLIISLQSDIQSLPPGFRAVFDHFPGKGPLAGLHAALKQIKQDHALIIPVDMPLIQPAMLQILLENRIPEHITAFEINGKIQAFPAVYPASISTQIENMLMKNHLKFIELFTLIPTKIIKGQPWKNYFANLNTPYDLKKYRI